MTKTRFIHTIALAIALVVPGCRATAPAISPGLSVRGPVERVGPNVPAATVPGAAAQPLGSNQPDPLGEIRAASFQTVTPLPAPERLMPPTPSVATDNLLELEALALANNPALARAYALVDARQGSWVQAGLPPNPTIGYIGEDMGDDGSLGLQGAYVQQQFIRGGKLAWARAAAGAAIDRAHANVEEIRWRVLTDVRIGYIDFLIGSRRVNVAERLVEVSTFAVRDTSELLRRGEVRRADLLRAEAQLGTSTILSKNAATQRDAAWRRLVLAIGIPDLGQPAMPEDVVQQRLGEAVATSINREEALQNLIASSPQLAGLRSAVDQARNRLERARVEAVPNLNVQLAMRYNDVSDSTVGSLQIGLPIPYRNWNQGGIQEAAANVAVTARAVDAKALDLQREFETVYMRYLNARNEVDQYTEPVSGILAKTEEVLRLTRLGYQAEEFNSLEMFTAQRLFHQANLAYLDAVRQLWMAAVEIEGLLLKDSLPANP